VQWEHRPGEASLSVSQETSFNGPGRVTAPGRLLLSPKSKELSMKIEINLPRPRNPLIALARFRRAGSHRPNGRTERQCAAEALRPTERNEAHPMT
jgi:hypothetical protein